MQWEVRTTGVDTNGGGFNPSETSAGTDYSQQNGAQFSYTDIIIQATTTNGKSVARPFTSVDVGNVVNITAGAGCTVARREIKSVASNVATFDAALGTAASTCTGAEGGALLTEQSISTANPTAAVAQNTVWVQSGTYSSTTARTWTNSIAEIGYQTTHGDNPTGTNRPLITTATNSIVLVKAGSSSGIFTFSNLRFSTTAGTPGICINPSASFNTVSAFFQNVKISGCTQGIASDAIVGGDFGLIVLDSTEITATTTEAVAAQSNLITRNSTWIHDNTGSGLRVLGATFTLIDHTVFYANHTFGLKVSGPIGSLVVANSVFYGTSVGCSTNPCGAVLMAATPTYSLAFSSNIFYSNTGWNIANNAGSSLLPLTQLNQANAQKAGGLGNIQTFTPAWAADSPAGVTLTADPFTNAAGSDFSLNSTAGGGAGLKGVGFPGVTGLIGTGYIDIGALQTSGAAPASAPINAIY